jgi:RHS repeat-associated protein
MGTQIPAEINDLFRDQKAFVRVVLSVLDPYNPYRLSNRRVTLQICDPVSEGTGMKKSGSERRPVGGRARMSAARWCGIGLSALAMLLLPGVARTVLAADVSQSVNKSWIYFDSYGGKPEPPDNGPGESGDFTVEGSGILTLEVSYSEGVCTDDPYRCYGGAYFAYQNSGGAWWTIGFSSGYWNDGLPADGWAVIEIYKSFPTMYRYRYRVTNAHSLNMRIGVAAFRGSNYAGDYVQQAQTNRFTLTFVADPSTISLHPDQAGGPCEHTSTKYEREQHNPEQPKSPGLPHYSVNTSFLNLVIEDMDFGCQSYAHDESLRRVWNMQPQRSGMFGNGWSFAYESSVLAKPYTGGGATLTLGSGETDRYSVSGISGVGTGTVMATYSRDTAGRGPTLTGFIDEATGTGYYTLTDKETKYTQRFDYVRDDADQHVYRLRSITDRNGNAMTLGYDFDGRIATLTDASNRQTAFSYDDNNHCTGMQTFDGRNASYQYDSTGNLTQSVDLAGNVIAYAYDDKNYPTTMTVAGKTTSFAYATNGIGARYLSSVTEPDGKVWHYAFGSGGTTQVTEPGGGVRSYANTEGRTTSVTDQLNYTTSTLYDAQYLPTKITDPKGNVTTFEYDGDGNLTKAIDPAGNATEFAYDENWNLISVTDALGHKTTYGYDAHDNLFAKTTPLGRVTLYMVDDRGRLTTVIPPDGTASYGFGYDDHGNVTSVTDPLGKTTRFAFEGQGLNLSGVTDALGHETTFSHDANRRLTGIVLPDQTSIQYGYDTFSLTSLTDGAGSTTTFERDPVQRITSITDPLGHSAHLAYNNDGDMVSATDSLGQTATVVYDAAHRATSSVDPLHGSVGFGLDAMDNLTALTDERGKATAMTYDNRGLLTSVRDPLGTTTAGIDRDALGRVSSVTNARGGIVSYLYDADGRIVGQKYDDNDATATTYEWSANSDLTSVSDPSGTKSFTYDLAGRVTAITYADGQTVATAYDDVGNVASLTYSDGLTVHYIYDALDRATRVSFAGSSLSLEYDAAGRLSGETRSNGVDSAYAYDAAGQLTRVTHNKGTSVVADLTYARNAAGLITEESGTWPVSAAPTAAENTAASYNDANGIVNWKGDAYSYDADSNLVGIAGSRNVEIVYDPENRPTALTRNGVTTEYTYDGLGNRVQARTTAITRNFYHSAGGRLLFDIDATHAVTTDYIYAGRRLVASGSPAAGFVFYHFDKTGNTLALTDAGGAVVAAFAYDPYGRVVARSGSATTAFTYVGAYGVMEEPGDLFFMKHRYFDAVTGRFIQRDPIGFWGGQSNLYAYVGGAPVNSIDPNGLCDSHWYDVGGRGGNLLGLSAIIINVARGINTLGIGLSTGVILGVNAPNIAIAAGVYTLGSVIVGLGKDTYVNHDFDGKKFIELTLPLGLGYILTAPLELRKLEARKREQEIARENSALKELSDSRKESERINEVLEQLSKTRTGRIW